MTRPTKRPRGVRDINLQPNHKESTVKLFKSRRAVTITLATTMLIGVGGVASASIPAGDGRIHACVGKNGATRIVDTDAGARCKSTEKRIAWNQRGPVGPSGATGATGPAGPPGPAGEAAPAVPIIKKGHCKLRLPADAGAGRRLLVKCLHNGPELHHVSVTPAHHDGYAEPVYVLEPVLDYNWKVDYESGSAGEIWVLVRIMRDLPRPDLPKDILLNWIGMPSTP